MEHLSARFYDHAQLDVEASKKEDRHVFNDVLMVELTVKGARGESISRPVTDSNRDELTNEYPEAWARYKGETVETKGTPLKVLKYSPARTRELEMLGIHSVEELANVSDGNIAKMREGMKMKNQATKWLEGIELAKNDVTAQQVVDLQARLEALEEENAKLAANQKTKPGPKAKVAHGENA